MQTFDPIIIQLSALQQSLPVVRANDMIGEGSIHIASLRTALSMLQSAEKAVVKIAPGVKANTTGKQSLVTAVNVVSSLIDGMEENLVEHAELRNQLENVSNHLDQAKGLMKKFDAERQAVAAAQDPSKQVTSAQLFGKSNRYAKTMPADGAKFADDISILRLPVVPMFANVVSAQQLASIGFHVESNDGFYTVLENQILIGINITKNSTVKPLVRAEEVASVLSGKMGEHLSIMGTDLIQGAGRNSAHSKGFIWFWALPHAMLDRMNKKLGTTALNNWGFPFK